MRKITILLAICLFGQLVNAQSKYFTKKAKVSFYSEAEEENIEAHNSRSISIFEKETESLEFSVLVKSFIFEKALMQEHFNENYMESDKFPKAKFKGKAEGLSKVDLSKDGTVKLPVTGNLIMHGVTKEVSTIMTFTVKSGKISAQSEFNVLLKDYNIKIPNVVGKKIAEEITIKVNILEYQKLAKK